ncbi:acetyl-CoA acetyltransferase [Mycobacterium paraffinicum]|uniref:Acetyl-CoA acetyltransferase n=1 Tax=Mycobacterium paraffinicum TaxID=53378 RepID=A0A1Q4I2C5_9MYCO|nr:steroid 3-ketoacyl-CoA thiolase [Mycobacterium paraffinicum]OJZ76121.1 acetyl-CoA acetyltransferase [Mycobacterium paraffinicum]
MSKKAVIVEAVRTPLGKKGRGLAHLHPAELLAAVFTELFKRTGVDAADVDQVIGGCVTTANEQAGNITRSGWLTAELPITIGATTIDCACGSGQQANHLISSMVEAGAIDVGVACGVESMSRVALHANKPAGVHTIRPDNASWEYPTQYEAAERIAKLRGLTRDDLDAFGLRSQQLAARAWADGAYTDEVVPLASPAGLVDRDEGIRDTSAEKLATLAPLAEGAMHTAATSSQLTDGAAAVLWMSHERAIALGLRPRARFRAHNLTGSDPYYLLDGPVEATARVLDQAAMKLGDIDHYEVNEAFASVPLSWARVHDADMDKLNPNGGAIALGHPVGCTGSRLVTSAVHHLERADRTTSLITMCTGGAMATAAVLERL